MATASAAMVGGWVASVSAATPLKVVAGAEYDPTFAYNYESDSLPVAPGAGVNNAGDAVGYSSVINQGMGIPNQGTWGQADRWSIKDSSSIVMSGLGMPTDGRINNIPVAINDSGVSAGTVAKYGPTGTSLGTRAVHWDAAGNVTELGTVGTTAGGVANASATAMNSSGLTVGTAAPIVNNVSADPRAVYWPANSTTPVILDGIGEVKAGSNGISATAVNDGGTIAGSGTFIVGGVSTGNRAIRWDAGGTAATVLGTISVGSQTNDRVVAINNQGIIIGSALLVSGPTRGVRAVRWDTAGNPTELGNLGVPTTGNPQTQAYAINDSGTVVGSSIKVVNGVALSGRPTKWNANDSAAIELPNLGGGSSGYVYGIASDINNLGAIVGALTVGGTFPQHATLWLPGSNAVMDLNTLIDPSSGWSLVGASAVSDTGVIAGTATFDPDGSGPIASRSRLYSMLVPQAGTYGQGDANLDTKVNFADLVVLAQHYGQSNSVDATNVGDLDLNGVTDFNDLVVLAQHYGSMTSITGLGDSSFQADWALANSLLPEPGSLAIATIGLVVTRRRRMA